MAEKRAEKTARAKRETTHFFDRQLILTRRAVRLRLNAGGLDGINKALKPLLETLPKELASPNPNVGSIMNCESLLKTRIGSAGKRLLELNKSIRTAGRLLKTNKSRGTAKAINRLMLEATQCDAEKFYQKMIEKDTAELEKIQQWKKEHGMA